MASSAIEAEGLVKEYPGDVRALRRDVVRRRGGHRVRPARPERRRQVDRAHLSHHARARMGTARVAGHDVSAEPALVRSTIGVVAQRGGADREATARENLRLSGRLHGLRGPELERRIDELLDRFGLREAADRIVRTFSGAWAQARHRARAGAPPRVLFLDEPTRPGPRGPRRHVAGDRRLGRDEGITVLLTTATWRRPTGSPPTSRCRPRPRRGRRLAGRPEARAARRRGPGRARERAERGACRARPAGRAPRGDGRRPHAARPRRRRRPRSGGAARSTRTAWWRVRDGRAALTRRRLPAPRRTDVRRGRREEEGGEPDDGSDTHPLRRRTCASSGPALVDRREPSCSP